MNTTEVRSIIDVEERNRIISELRIIDDVMMKLVFDNDPETTAVLLNAIFDRDDMTVLSVTSQREVTNPNGRSVRFDIYAIDSDGKHYDIELQRSDSGADVRRARFNSSMLDSKLLEVGQDTDELVDAYVIFITEHDVRKRGRALYRFDRMETETHELLGDGSHIIYVNGAYVSDDRIGKLMHDLRCRRVHEMNSAVLAKKVNYFKEPEGGNSHMCKALEDFAISQRKKEREKHNLELISNMLNLEISLDTIAKILNITIEDVTRLSKEIVQQQ